MRRRSGTGRAGAIVIAAALIMIGAGACSSGSSTARLPTTSTPALSHPRLRFVTMNVLHGALCDDGPAHCAAAARMQLLARQVASADCPEVIGLEEVAPWWRAMLVARVTTLCHGVYHVVSPPVGVPYLDAETVLSALPTSGARRFDLAARASQRRALRVVVDAPIGRVVLVVTHVGTGADDFGNGGASCSDTHDCPPPCDPAGAAFACQILQLRDIATESPHDDRVATIIAGDLNLVPTASPLRVLTGAGFVDTYRAAGLPECDPATGTGCTSGRDDTHLATLRDPRAHDTARVDDIFLLPTTRCPPSYGPATGLFGAQPAAVTRGDVAWVSDHTGVEVELGCAGG